MGLHLSGMGAVTYAALALRRRQIEIRFGFNYSTLLGLMAAGYVVFMCLGIPSVVTVLTNNVADMSAASAARTTLFGLWIWALQGKLHRLSRGRCSGCSARF